MFLKEHRMALFVLGAGLAPGPQVLERSTLGTPAGPISFEKTSAKRIMGLDHPANKDEGKKLGGFAMASKPSVKVGCCGFAMAQKEYFQHFELIEIQQTFYQLPRLKTAQRWRESAPEAFQFTLKAWQLITHPSSSPTYRRLKERISPAALRRCGRFQGTREVFEAWERTARFAEALGASIIVFQCPPSFVPTEENVANLSRFFLRIDRQEFTFVWEPRGPWPKDLVKGLCRELNLVHCVDPFKGRPQFGDIQYFRLHGMSGYSHFYDDLELGRVVEWTTWIPTYVLFNNNWMIQNALRFRELCGKGSSRGFHHDTSQGGIRS